MKKRKAEFLTNTERTKCINEIIAHFEIERGEEIGIIAAGDILELILESTKALIYNKAITDIRKLVKEKNEMLDVDIDLLIKTK